MNTYNTVCACVFLSLLAGHCVAQLQVEDAWIQLPSSPTTADAAAFMTIHNPQLRAQTIVGVSANCCSDAILHKKRREGDKVVFDRLAYLVIPSQAKVQLTPDDLQLGLREPQEVLTTASKIKVTFSFGDGSTQEFELGVKPAEQQ